MMRQLPNSSDQLEMASRRNYHSNSHSTTLWDLNQGLVGRGGNIIISNVGALRHMWHPQGANGCIFMDTDTGVLSRKDTFIAMP